MVQYWGNIPTLHMGGIHHELGLGLGWRYLGFLDRLGTFVFHCTMV
jgi:hypothetical protein